MLVLMYVGGVCGLLVIVSDDYQLIMDCFVQLLLDYL